MSNVDAPVIPSPTPGLPEFHLIAVSHGPSTDSLLYIPLSDKPALVRDILRIDRLPSSAKPLAAILQDWLIQYQTSFDVPGLMHRVELTTPDEFLVYAGFSQHPIVGAHHTHWRYLRQSNHDYSVQFIRRLDPLSLADLISRFAFLRDWTASDESVRSQVTAFTPFASAAHAQSERIRTLTVDPTLRPQLMSMPADELRSALVGASPFHNPEVWANLARFYGRTVVDKGLIEEFDTATDCLKAALVVLHDARGEPFLNRLLYDVAENLADLLMYTFGDARAANVARAVELYRMLAAVWSEPEPGRARIADVMAAFGALVLDPDSPIPFADRLSARGRAALQEPDRALEMFEFLIGYVNRLSYIARRKGRSLYAAACLAADIAQVVVEGIYGAPGVDVRGFLGRVTQAFQAQLDSQLRLWGLTQQDLDRDAAAFVAKFRRSREPPPLLLLLRPLATSRRIKMENQFRSDDDDVLWQNLPRTLTLESALHVAFVKRFNTEALGGPIDLFGMQRSTALGAFSSLTESWQSAASLLIQSAHVIIAVFDEREALYWEMSELARQRAFGRLIFVIPPTPREATADGYSTAAVHRLRGLGLELPGRVPPSGFILFKESGAVERTLALDALWSGELLEIVWSRERTIPVTPRLDAHDAAVPERPRPDGGGTSPLWMRFQSGFSNGQSTSISSSSPAESDDEDQKP